MWIAGHYQGCGNLKLATLILDGEVCIFDQQLVSRFEWLRYGTPPGVATPPIFMAFDIPYAAGRDLRPLELHARRNVIEDTLSTTRISCSRFDAWPTMASRHGSRCLSATTKGWWQRTRSHPT